MNNQTILVCDEQGNFLGEYIPKEEGHRGLGKRHLAITVLLYNSKGEVLLQKRKHLIFDNIWDFTGATHPLHKDNGTDESFEEATTRCLEREYGIKDLRVENLGTFNYFAAYENGLCEHEHCAMMVGGYDGEVHVNQEVGYGYKWMDKAVFLKDVEENSTNYSPWAVEGIKVLKNKGFFNLKT